MRVLILGLGFRVQDYGAMTLQEAGELSNGLGIGVWVGIHEVTGISGSRFRA